MNFKTATLLFSLCALCLIYPLAACGSNGDMHENPPSKNQAKAQNGAASTQTGPAAPRDTAGAQAMWHELLAALKRQLPWLEPSGVSAGLHLVTWLPPDLDEPAHDVL